MITKNQTSNLPYSFQEVEQLGSETYTLIQRDADQLALFGVNPEKADSFKALVEAFKSRTFDEEYVILQKEKTEAKTNEAEALRLGVYNLALVVDLLPEEKSKTFEALNINSVSSLNDFELAKKARLCVNVLNSHIEDFAEVGLTTEKLDALNTQIDNFTLALDQQAMAEFNRHLAQSNRIEQANELYSEIVKFRTLGRKMWAVSNYELSQSYVMPKKASSQAGAEPDPDPDPGDGVEISIS